MEILSEVHVDDITIQHRTKGNRNYSRIEADQQTLEGISAAFDIPITASNGQNKVHITTSRQDVIAVLVFGGGLGLVVLLGIIILPKIIGG